ncbi:MAG: sortase [Anaerolineae bacterium]
MRQTSTSRAAGNLLLAAGLIILLGVAGYFGWNQLQAAALRAQLRTAPTEDPTVFTAQASRAFTPEPSAAVNTVPAPGLATAASPTPRPATATHALATAAATQPQTVATDPVTPAFAEPAAAQPSPAAPLPSPTQAPASTPTLPPAGMQPVRLVIPDLKIDTKVVPMGWETIQTADGPRSEWVIPKYEAGHHINSALLGQPGNLVISGHNNIYGQVFKPISFAWDNDRRSKVDDFTDRSDVLNGRRVEVFDATGQAYTYVIEEFYRLRDTGVPLQQRIANGRFMQPTQDTRLTLITCWPPTNNTHRLVVIARPVK